MDQNDDLIEQDPYVQTPPPTSGARQLPRDPSTQQKTTSVISLCALAVSVLALCFSGIGLWYAISNIDNSPPVIDEPVIDVDPEYISFQGTQIPVQEGVALNPYDNLGFYFDKNNYICYENGNQKAIPGIDVSIHQGIIDWKKVADAGFEFAMIRVGFRGYASEGKLMMDENYVMNIVGARKAGLDVGVYFFSQAVNLREIDEEVAMLQNLIATYDITYPVVFDWEFITHDTSARTTFATGDDITQLALRFCEQIEQAGYTPAIYFNMDLAYRYLDLSLLDHYTFWLAQYNARPTFYYDFDMWQYSQSGTVDGIDGPVDLNLSFRDFAAEKK